MCIFRHLLVITLQASIASSCTFEQTSDVIQGELKHDLVMKDADDCVRFCFYDTDCTHVALLPTSQGNSGGVACMIYMAGPSLLTPSTTVYKIIRNEAHSWCPKSVSTAVPIEPTSESPDVDTPLEKPYGGAFGTRHLAASVNDKGCHAYSSLSSSVLLQTSGYTISCMMILFNETIQGCHSIPVFLRGEYDLRLFFW